MFDTDAPTGASFWHWLVFNIPPDVTSLPLDATKNMPPGAIQGYGDAGVSAYHGPCPPVGDPPHHYWITDVYVPAPLTSSPAAAGVRIVLRRRLGSRAILRWLQPTSNSPARPPNVQADYR
jgi:phosphatidylethanolamine-binding protein (PEBP) family uncharacterized protein